MHPTQNTVVLDGRPTRNITGTPETDADRRFFDLREAGYLGPVDQDGHPTVTLWPNEPVPAGVATTLRHAARYLSRHGWVQGCYYRQTARVFTPATDAAGAIGMVCYGSPVDNPLCQYHHSGFPEFEAAFAYLDDFVSVAHGYGLFTFNDTPGRTVAQVIAELCRAAQMWDHLDTGPELAHADYPHTPGTLYDCPACESECFCTRDFQCVHHALISEEQADASDTADASDVVGGAA